MAGSRLSTRASDSVQTLNPGYFAIVMATGIISVGMTSVGMPAISAVLLSVAVVAYVTLVVLFIWRIARFRSDIRADFASPARAFSFFTFVAASGVLGTRLLLGSQTPLAVLMLAIAAVAWLVLGYVIPWSIVVAPRPRPRAVLAEANGTWFIWAVGSQSVAVLAATLEPVASIAQRELALVAVFSWSVGAVLYAYAGVCVGIRLLIHPVRPTDIGPQYWVAMGATAITVLAGARIVEMADAPMTHAARGLVGGLSIVFWCFGTWLVPALLGAGWWRHIRHGIPLRYEASLWSMIFPLGMYGVASINLGEADALPIIEFIGRCEIWLALAAWALVIYGLLVNFVRSVVLAPEEHRETSSRSGG
ncbi:MAG: tellurite resistance/C4-dicarboxylate transporter family protein [Candidatus Nanopelagicales bacterium]